uniref:MHC class II alpha chain N-terminal domain-containing protein n=1 Tax=Stegastes partitus TaxID=144197 RepID=A0A3B5ADC2_9TELE
MAGFPARCLSGQHRGLTARRSPVGVQVRTPGIFLRGVSMFSPCSKHLLRFMTFCQRVAPGDGQYDIESDGDQLLYVDPVVYLTYPRLPEFEQQWSPDPGLAEDAYVSLGTCYYNIPRAIKGEKSPPEVIEVEGPADRQVVETAVCVCGVVLGLIGLFTGLGFIRKANRPLQTQPASAAEF